MKKLCKKWAYLGITLGIGIFWAALAHDPEIVQKAAIGAILWYSISAAVDSEKE